jgi:hypothetical protein
MNAIAPSRNLLMSRLPACGGAADADVLSNHVGAFRCWVYGVRHGRLPTSLGVLRNSHKTARGSGIRSSGRVNSKSA